MTDFMNLRLWQRLFLTFAALASIALAGFVFWQQQAFRSGFLAYLNTAALDRLQPVSDRLAEAYAENGSWRFLGGNPSQFAELIAPELRRAMRPPPPPGIPGRAMHPCTGIGEIRPIANRRPSGENTNVIDVDTYVKAICSRDCCWST